MERLPKERANKRGSNKNVYIEASFTERLGAIGQTGSGKSFFMLRLVSQSENAIIIDTKREIALADFKPTNDPRVAVRGGKVIYRPKRNRLEDDFFFAVWGRYGRSTKSDILLYLDEAGHVTSPSKIGDGLKLCVQAGRSVGVGVWWAAQQSVQVHNTLLSQSEKLAVFRVPVQSDRDKIGRVSNVGDAAEYARTLANHEFMLFGWPEYQPIEADDGLEIEIFRLAE